jgi:hypothetical protein
VQLHELGHVLGLHDTLEPSLSKPSEAACDMFAQAWISGVDDQIASIPGSEQIATAALVSALPAEARRQLLTYIEDEASQAAYGVREKVIQVRDILPLGVSTTDFERAANTLYDLGVAYLERHKGEQAEYEVEVVGLTHTDGSAYRFQVGDTFRVQFEGTSDDQTTLSVDQDLYLMGFSRTFDSSGADTWKLTLSTILREIPDDGNRTAAFLRELEAVKAAPLPYILFGDNVARMSESGLELVSLSGYEAAEPSRKIQWTTQDFATVHSETYGARDEGLDTNYMISVAHAAFDSGHISGIRRADNTNFDIAEWMAQSDGGFSEHWAIRLGNDTILALVWNGTRYSLQISPEFNGSYQTLGGGSMETANTGQFLIPAGPANGNWVRSGAANAYGTWYPLPISDAVAPAAPTTSATGLNVTMPPTVAAGDMLIAIITEPSGPSVGPTPGRLDATRCLWRR